MEGDVGLTLVGCRFNDAQVGRFITRDTDLDEAPYIYCDGDPVNGVDPSGHSTLGAGAAGTVIAIVVFFMVATVIEGATGGAATPIIVAIVAGGLSGAAGSATVASVDGQPPGPAAVEGGMMGAGLGACGRLFIAAEEAAAGGSIAE